MKEIIVILTLLLLTLPVGICASEVKEYRLENGLKVLIVETHKAPVATLQVWYRTGSRDEPNGKSGLSHLLEAAAYKVHPYQRPVIGWMSDLKSIERDDLYNYYKAHYSPSNAVIVIVGDVKPDQIIEHIKSSFDNIPPGTLKKNINFLEPEQQGERRVLLKREAELPYLLVAYHTPSFPHEDSYALNVLNLILSGGKSSRLYTSLVYEKKIALTVEADYDGLKLYLHLHRPKIHESP